jgi:hypothetical protein
MASSGETAQDANPTVSDSLPPAGPDRVTTPPATRPPPADPTSAQRDDPVPETPPPVTTDPVVQEEPAPPAISEAAAEDMLFRQMDRLTDAPGAATYLAVVDSATQMWNEERLPDPVRALAAYLIASGRLELGETEAARTWARRAVTLAPGNAGFQRLLDQLGGQS